MTKLTIKKALETPEIRQEIERHKWFESEKAGYDIGIEAAAEDWIARFGDLWQQKQAPARPARSAPKSAKPAPKKTPKAAPPESQPRRKRV